MADEIQITVKLTAEKNGAILARFEEINTNFDMAGDDAVGGTQIIGTSTEALAINDVAIAEAHIVVKNLDATNFVLLSMTNDSSDPFSKLSPGKFCYLPAAASGTYYAKADTASCRVAYTIVEA
jgi:hypothetical protein